MVCTGPVGWREGRGRVGGEVGRGKVLGWYWVVLLGVVEWCGMVMGRVDVFRSGKRRNASQK